jgi:hypothetical protein
VPRGVEIESRKEQTEETQRFVAKAVAVATFVSDEP